MSLRNLTQSQCLVGGFLLGFLAMGVTFNLFRDHWQEVGFGILLMAAVTGGLVREARRPSVHRPTPQENRS